jgi:hypothetical protein
MKMKSALRGRSTSGVEVTNVSKNGFWLLLDGNELFVEFKHFPWFRDASIGELVNVERPATHHLYWPDLDVDLAVESLTNPERYPLVSRVRTSKARRSVSRATTTGKGKGRTTRSRGRTS